LENKNKQYNIISCYAPILLNSEKNPVVRQNFYDKLESVLNKLGKRNVFIGGDLMLKLIQGF